MLDVTKKCVDAIKGFFQRTNGKTAVIGISGGKDSTIAAALCVKALGKENVLGVLMPNGIDSLKDDSISDEQRVCKHLGIKYAIVDIHQAYTDIQFNAENALYIFGGGKVEKANLSQQSKLNLAPRIRMSTLYAIAQSVEGGRVINTTNACESFVGYGTLWGDTVGDFAIFGQLYISEVYMIGDDLELPYDLVHKTPADGLTGKSDEEVLGVTYADIETYAKADADADEWQKLKEIMPSKTFNKIWEMSNKNSFKRKLIQVPCISRSYIFSDPGDN
jgi:NAD+ synthase